MKIKLQNSSGYAFVFAIVFVAIMIMLGGAILSFAGINRSASLLSVRKSEALNIAEAGIDKAIQELNLDANFSGESNIAFGNGHFTTTISTIDQYTRRISSTATVTEDSGEVVTKTVSAVASINTETVSFSYGVQVGQGGLTMNNNSVIEGNVFSTGNITGSGTITGDATVTVANSTFVSASSTTFVSGFNFGNSSSRVDAAVKFIPSMTDTVVKTSFYIKKTGSPSNLALYILSDNGGKPSKTVLASGNISASTITTNYGWIDGTLTSNPTLTAGTTYWLMLVAGSNASKYYTWGMNTGQTGGMYSANWNAGTPVWTSAGGLFNFKIYSGSTATYISGVHVNGAARAPSLTGCVVGGDAYYETTNSCTVGGATHPNTPPQSPVAYPISDAQISDWEATAVSGGTYYGNYTVNGTATLGPHKISGDLILNNNAILYLTGPVWVEGNITVNNGSHIYVDNSLGNTGTILIADYTVDTSQKGVITVNNNSEITGNGGSASFPLVISTYSGGATAIDVNNNAASTIFFAPYGTINLNNNASVKEMTGKSVHLNNNAVVDYESGLQDAHFSTGPGGSWAFVPGTYVITQ